MSSICPLNKRLAVRRFESKEKTQGGLYIPEGAQEPQIGGEVLAVGKGIDDIEVGNTVIFGKYSGTDIAVEGKSVLMLKYEDVLGVFEK
jgi:chaperonin GroES